MGVQAIDDLRALAGLYLRQWSVEFARAAPLPGYRRFILLGRGRTGSNFLRGLLNSHRRVVAYGELFRDNDAIGWEFPRHDRMLQSRRLIRMMQKEPVRFLDEVVFGAYPATVGAVGFKLFYYHARDPSREPLWLHLQEQQQIRVLHLKRANILRMILSEKRAFETDRWTNTTGEPEKPLSIRLDFDECLRRFEEERAMAERFDRFFADHPKLDLVYEQLCSESHRQLERVQRFLGLESEPLRPSTYRQSNLPLPQAIANYHELRERFDGTPWHRFFDE